MPFFTMKALKTFDYYLDGNRKSTIKEGESVPEIAHEYALKNNLAEKAKSAPETKAKKPPANKAK